MNTEMGSVTKWLKMSNRD